MKTFKLMIKTHSTTQLKYLCITARDDWETYTGSGTYWKRHLAKHGTDFTTELLFQSECYDDFVSVCIFFSDYLDVAKSPNFANAIPEVGYGEHDRPNMVVFWEYADEETKEKIFAKRAKSLACNGNHWSVTEKRAAVVDKIVSANWHNDSRRDEMTERISRYMRSYWDKIPKDMRNTKMQHIWEGMMKFYEDKTTVKYLRWKESVIAATQHRWDNMTDIDRQKIGEKISKGRLNMTDESKKERAVKIGIAFASSEKRKQFNDNMKLTRNGIDNPAALVCTWMGNVVTKGNLLKILRSDGLSMEDAVKIAETRDDCDIPQFEVVHYDSIECSHCKKVSTGKPSSFKRWHFDNCKNKES